jgi:hypothetical protein
MPTPEKHSSFGASSSHAWLNCPQYIKVQEMFPDTTSEYAEAGRLAHAIAEYKARCYFLEPVGKRAYNARLKKFREDPAYDPGMEEATDLYLDTLKSQALDFSSSPFVALETMVDYSDYAPDGFGTADCIMIGGDRIVICDYKNGAGVPVEAEDNSQMKLYALGAVQTFRAIYGDTIRQAHLVIVQPHAGGVKEWDTTVDELDRWGREVVFPAAQRALAGEDPACPGSWCRFCRGRSQCTARAKLMLELGNQYQQAPAAGSPKVPADYSGPLLTDAEVGAALTAGAGLVAWYKDLQDYALLACLDGKTIPGFKAVEGRGSRNWADVDSAFKTLQERGVAEALLWERKPVTAPALEKALGKKAFAEAADGLVVKQPGKPTLAPETDKRPPYNAAAAAFGGGPDA